MRTLKSSLFRKSFRSQHHKSKGADSIHRNTSTKYKKKMVFNQKLEHSDDVSIRELFVRIVFFF